VAPAVTAPAASGDPLRARAWRWHFLAALLVVPFVLWQSATGTIYLWSEQWVDARHADLRFVSPGAARVPLDAQVALARTAAPGSRVGSVLVSAEANRSTQVMFENARGLPVAVFVDPYRGELLGTLGGADFAPGWSRKLHGGWPLGNAGSWLLEVGASWTIVMVITGLVLWWPRNGRSLAQVLWPRLRSGRRVLWRDLHACVAVWFSLLIVAFLLTALPWTSFWGERVLRPVQAALQQQTPPAAGFAPVFISSQGAPGDSPSLESIYADARARKLEGTLFFYLVDGPPGSAISVRTLYARAAQDRYALYDRATGQALATADWSDFPPLAKAVATGVNVHEGSFFGRLGPWVNTVVALALAWIAGTGLMAWWRRKPQGALGTPARERTPWPRWLLLAAAILFALLPLLALSALALLVLDRIWLALAGQARGGAGTGP
jgi:uncharacterized iron-regulated membrane protein